MQNVQDSQHVGEESKHHKKGLREQKKVCGLGGRSIVVIGEGGRQAGITIKFLLFIKY